MKKLLLLSLTLLTLNVFGQDTINTKNEVDLLTSKLTTLHNKISTLDLDISKIKLDLDWKKITKFATIYGAVNGGNSLSDADIYSVTNGLETQTITTPYDYSVILGVRKISRMGYEPKEAFKTGKENSFSDAATVGRISGFEYLFELSYVRQEGENYANQHHFLRYIDDNYILKGEYLEDGFADIKYFETSQRYRHNIEDLSFLPEMLQKGKLSLNIGAVQRLSEPYGYDPLEEWKLSNGNLHYTFLALEEGYNANFISHGIVQYTDLQGNIVAENTEIWEGVVIPQVLSDYTEKKRNELENTIQHSLVLGFDYYYYSKNLWLHSWGNVMPWHYDDGGEFSYHKFNNGEQWYDYSGGLIFGYKYSKSLGVFIEGKYNKYWNREWHDFSFGVNYIIF